VVFEWPPGSTAAPSCGSGRSDTLASSSSTGAGQRIVAPVGMIPPSASALRRRSATGSIASAAASLSICASCAKQVCTAPNPRIAPHGGLSVYTTYESIVAFGTS
jgi:hypothetical protein